MNWSFLSSVFKKQLIYDINSFCSSQGLFAEFLVPRDDHFTQWNISRIESKNVVYICLSLICTRSQIKNTFVSISVNYFKLLTLQNEKKKIYLISTLRFFFFFFFLFFPLESMFALFLILCFGIIFEKYLQMSKASKDYTQFSYNFIVFLQQIFSVICFSS